MLLFLINFLQVAVCKQTGRSHFMTGKSGLNDVQLLSWGKLWIWGGTVKASQCFLLNRPNCNQCLKCCNYPGLSLQLSK